MEIQRAAGLHPVQSLLAELFSACERIESTTSFVKAATADGVGPDAAWEALADALEALESAGDQLTSTTDEMTRTVGSMSVLRANLSQRVSMAQPPLADVALLWSDSLTADARRPGLAFASEDGKARAAQLFLVPDPDAPAAVDALAAAISDVHNTSHGGGAVHTCTEPLCREFTEFTAHERNQD